MPALIPLPTDQRVSLKPARKFSPRSPLFLLLTLSIITAHAPSAVAAHPVVFGHESPQEPATQTGKEPSGAPSTQASPHMRPRTVGPKTESVHGATPNAQDDLLPEEVDEDEVVRVDSNLVIIPASVVDNRGRAVTNLKIEDFELRVDGQLRPISDLSRAEMPVFITMLFDNSASLSVAREFEKQAAVRFFSSLVRPIDRAAIYSISTNPTLSQPLTNDVSRLIGTIESFGKPDGATALFDTLAQAADYMRPIPGRKVLVLVSDGTDTVSDITFEEAVTRTLRAECQVYVVQTRQVEDPSLRDPISEQRMLKLAEQTGGAVYVPQSIDDLDAAFSQISQDLSQQYLLSYYPQEERRDNYFRFINLRVKSRPQMRVRARKGFYPHAAQMNLPPPPDADSRAQSPSTQQRAMPNEGSEIKRPDTQNPARRTPGQSSSNRSTDRGLSSARRVGPSIVEDDVRSGSREQQESTTTLTVTVAKAERARPAPDTPVFNAGTPAHADGASAPTSTVVLPSSHANSTPPRTTPAVESSEEKSKPDDKTTVEKVPSSKVNSSERVDDDEGEKIVSGGVLNSRALHLPMPSYPQHAKSLGISGTVIVEVMIDERGKVIEAKAISGPKQLFVTAVDAARQAKFSPTLLSGVPVRIKGRISYNFKL